MGERGKNRNKRLDGVAEAMSLKFGQQFRLMM